MWLLRGFSYDHRLKEAPAGSLSTLQAGYSKRERKKDSFGRSRHGEKDWQLMAFKASVRHRSKRVCPGFFFFFEQCLHPHLLENDQLAIQVGKSLNQ